MPAKAPTINTRRLDTAREAIARAVAGTARDEAIDRETLLRRVALAGTELEPITLRNALKRMVADGDRIAAEGATSARRYFDPTAKGWEPEAVATPPAAPAPPAAAPTPPAGRVEFSVYSDGRLAIIDGDDILILQPDDTGRLAYFLGCFQAPSPLRAPQLAA